MYGNNICKHLEDQVDEEVDIRLSIMKPIMAQWMIDLYDYLVSRPDISINGYHSRT